MEGAREPNASGRKVFSYCRSGLLPLSSISEQAGKRQARRGEADNSRRVAVRERAGATTLS